MNVFRNHWKKCTFATLLSGYGIYSAHVNYQISSHMRNLCKEASCEYTSTNGVPKRVIVVMNPMANKKKSEKMFKQYCEPLLHLGGFSVEIVKTTYAGHVKDLIESLPSLPDAIVVAGGDGSILESITGLLRRNDTPCPIVMLPLGCQNETWKLMNYEPTTKLEYIKALSKSVLPLIQQTLSFAHVMKYEVVNADDTTGKDLKPIYGLNKFSWGLLRDIDHLKDKYWYFGPMRYYAAVIFNAFSNKMSWSLAADFSYTPPCGGCQNCLKERRDNMENKTFLGKFWRQSKNKEHTNYYIENGLCKQKTCGYLECNQIDVVCEKSTENIPELKATCLASLKPGFEFLKRIPEIKNQTLAPSTVLESRTLEIRPGDENHNKGFYSIDGEEYDVRPIKISILPSMIPIFN